MTYHEGYQDRRFLGSYMPCNHQRMIKTFLGLRTVRFNITFISYLSDRINSEQSRRSQLSSILLKALSRQRGGSHVRASEQSKDKSEQNLHINHILISHLAGLHACVAEENLRVK